MPKIDVEQGLAPSTIPTDTALMAFFRSWMPDFYFVNTPLSRMRRHLNFLERLAAENIIVDFQRPAGAHYTELTLCAYDDAEPGLLSKVAGTLFAQKINVHTAWIHTLADPTTPGSKRRVVLDTLILSEPYLGRTRPLSTRTQLRISEKLRSVLAGSTTLSQVLGAKVHKLHAPLSVYELTSNEGPGDWTLIKLRASDNNGVLYRITHAIAMLELNIAHAQINTFERAVDDVFFVSPKVGKLSADEAQAKASRLKALLQNEDPD